ncbi:MAG TPA: class I tRNA ligase family protein [Patescibacteria group bacterium]
MEQKYNPHEIEAKWRSIWPKERDSYKLQPGDEPYYVLDMISYPSSEGLHMGHWRPYTIADVWARYNTLLGKKVLSPVGFDAFGLPAENAAIKNGRHPADYTVQSMGNFTRQIQEMGKMYDWSTLINTSSPEYYKWTQWIFTQLYKNGLAYKKAAAVWWCPSCQTVLANEQVISGECERCGSEVIRKNLSQWFFKITDFADDLLSFEGLNWPAQVKTLQTNWIGKSQGAEIDFKVVNSEDVIRVFTTRPDTLMGVTYIVVAPEHTLVTALMTDETKGKVEAYVLDASKKSDIDRMADDRTKTGVFTGSYVIHPITNAHIPVWVADYVVGTYGTGAVMAVPAHDQRDYEFAQVYDLPIQTVIEPVVGTPQEHPEYRQSIVALVHDPKQDRYLTINWGEMGGTLLIGGGREEGEDPVACAQREIEEETGYSNVAFINKTETIHHSYFAHSKNVARAIDAVGVSFELASDATTATRLEAAEQGKFTVEWLTADEADKRIIDPLHRCVFERFAKGNVYTGYGVLVNSGEFDGLTSEVAKDKIVAHLESQGRGRLTTQYRLRDWLISRQRYWGAPIPVVTCEKCGEQVVPDDQLPVVLPKDVEFLPTGGSPLERHPSFKHTTCPTCGGDAIRETDTLDTFVDSSWYFLRYTDPKNPSAPFSLEGVKAWLPVDFYVGGTEHSILHLLYARFVMKALHRLGHVPYHEPFQTFFGNGMVYLNGKKMSKSKGNIVNPDDMVKRYGVDAMRGYILFMGPADQDVEWQENGITGVSRFLDKAWQSFAKVDSSNNATSLSPAIQKAYQDVNAHLQRFTFNRCISSLMIALNEVNGHVNKAEAEVLIRLFAPFFPHFAEEVWSNLGHTSSIFEATWPEVKIEASQTASYVVQVNGKLRATLDVLATAEENEVIALASELTAVKSHLEGKSIEKTIFVAGRIINFVVR